MHPFYILLALFAVLCVAAFVFMLRWERRTFLRQGKARAWLRVRLASIPILCALVALIALPTSGISGMEALGVLYLLLLAVAPPLWFVAHWLVGRFAQPTLSFGESAQIAFSPIALILALAWLAQVLQSFAWQLLGAFGISA